MRRKDRRPDWLPLGGVSEGTHDSTELIEAFAYALETFYSKRRVPASVKHVLDDVEQLFDGDEHDEDENETLDELVGELEQELEQIAPPYAYFGAAEGTRSHFGFWVSRNQIEEAVHSGDAISVDDTADVPRGYTGDVFVVNDHGNMTYYTASRGRLREVWSVV